MISYVSFQIAAILLLVGALEFTGYVSGKYKVARDRIKVKHTSKIGDGNLVKIEVCEFVRYVV